MGRSRSRERHDRKRSRSRSRDRDRERRSRRSRSRERRDRGWSDPDPAVAQIQALAAAQAQAQLQRQMIVQHQALLAAVPAVAPPAAALVAAAAAGGATLATAAVDSTTARKSREVYIGNLAIGQVSPEMLTELFNAALAGMVPDPILEPPVLNVKMDTTGRFAFVELRTEELATTAMSLDKTEVLGRAMNVGRPKGYVPGSSAPAANDTLAAAQQVIAALVSGGATNVVLLENMLTAADMRNADERQEVSVMVYEESVRCGKVLGIAVPVPPPEVADNESSRVYIKFATAEQAGKCKEMMDGRLFDENKVKVTYVTEVDYSRAAAGEWIRPGQAPPVPPVQPVSSIPGLNSIPGLGLGGLPAPGTGLIPGLPGNAPLAIPSLLGGSIAPAAPTLGFPGFPPPP